MYFIKEQLGPDGFYIQSKDRADEALVTAKQLMGQGRSVTVHVDNGREISILELAELVLRRSGKATRVEQKNASRSSKRKPRL